MIKITQTDSYYKIARADKYLKLAQSDDYYTINRVDLYIKLSHTDEYYNVENWELNKSGIGAMIIETTFIVG